MSIKIVEITSQLAVKMNEAAELQNHVSGINAEISELRDQLQQEMVAGSYKTLEESGIQATIRTKKYPQVVDADDLYAHIVALDLEPNYTVTRFDQVKARNDAVKNGWPGVEVEVRDELVVLVVKAVAS